MKSYVKKYLDYFGLSIGDGVLCESCGRLAVNIHHLSPRSTHPELLDEITNLCAVCMECHVKAERSKEFNEVLREKHLRKLNKL